jgi:predicted nucleic acid-binding protein
MTTTTLLIDSNVWSHLILSELPMREKVAAQLAALHLKYPDAAIATSAMCVAECLVAARRLPDDTDANSYETIFKARFNKPGVLVVPVTEQVLDRAATLRAKRLKLAAARGSQLASADGGKLLLPDATIAASCLEFKPPAVLVTENVADFQYLEDGIPKTVADLMVECVG